MGDVAISVGVSKDTLKRWLDAGKIEEPLHDGRGWRIWREVDIERIRAYKDSKRR